MLVLWRQANVVVDKNGRIRLTEYGLALINTDPSDGSMSRWDFQVVAPEIIDPPPYEDNSMPTTESKAADGFAFAMFAVEVFTGKIPFGGETQATSALRILREDRPETPENAQEVGLTGEI